MVGRGRGRPKSVSGDGAEFFKIFLPHLSSQQLVRLPWFTPLPCMHTYILFKSIYHIFWFIPSFFFFWLFLILNSSFSMWVFAWVFTRLLISELSAWGVLGLGLTSRITDSEKKKRKKELIRCYDDGGWSYNSWFWR